MTRQEAGRMGGRKRAAMADFAAHQSAAGKASAAVNDMSALGRRGAQACIAKYGYPRLFGLVRTWRLDHPSSHEQAVAAILDRLGVWYEREAEPLGPEALLTVDFLLVDNRAIEVNGHVHDDEPLFADRDGTLRRHHDETKLKRLSQAGIRILVIDHRQMDRAEDMIRAFVAQ